MWWDYFDKFISDHESGNSRVKTEKCVLDSLFENLIFEDALFFCAVGHDDTSHSVGAVLWQVLTVRGGRWVGQGSCRVCGVSREVSLLRSVSPARKHLAAGCFAAGSTWLKPRPDDRSYVVWSCSPPHFAKTFSTDGFEYCGTNWCGDPGRPSPATLRPCRDTLPQGTVVYGASSFLDGSLHGSCGRF